MAGRSWRVGGAAVQRREGRNGGSSHARGCRRIKRLDLQAKRQLPGLCLVLAGARVVQAVCIDQSTTSNSTSVACPLKFDRFQTPGPMCAKVRIVMAEETDYDYVAGGRVVGHDQHRRHHPLGKVPCLVMEAGDVDP